MRSFGLLLAVAVAATSCSGASGSARSSTPPAVAAASGEASSSAAHFLNIPLSDVRTGERFTLGGFSGKVTFFIAMAVW